ncbi:MAG: hypothetical protein FRX49_01475 [Trebouxia sp. A1-2]|nr:MAG: hypothetical protein FRX49_01475 [Trebouxia sp. A1-2]
MVPPGFLIKLPMHKSAPTCATRNSNENKSHNSKSNDEDGDVNNDGNDDNNNSKCYLCVAQFLSCQACLFWAPADKQGATYACKLDSRGHQTFEISKRGIYLIISFTSQITMPVASRAAEVMGTNSVPLHGCLDPAEILANQLVYTSKHLAKPARPALGHQVGQHALLITPEAVSDVAQFKLQMQVSLKAGGAPVQQHSPHQKVF